MKASLKLAFTIMKFKLLHKEYENTTPINNPITFQFNKNFDKPLLGHGGKIFFKRGRMNDGIFYKHDDTYYAVPRVWERPFGFTYDAYSCWVTKSEILALRHYREYGYAQNKLAKKFDLLLKEQDYLYSLSKAIDSDVDLPKVKSTFEARKHQKVGIEFGKLTNGRFIIADQQRTGKSYTALLYVLSQIWDSCLIVCPANVIPIWLTMIETICNREVNLLKSGNSLRSEFNVVSYDILHTIKNLNTDIAIADEAHFFIEADARRSVAVNSIKADKKIALTGTPIMNNVNNIMGIVDWVIPELGKEMIPFLHALRKEEPYEQARIVGEELKRRCLLLRETNQISTGSEPYINFIELDAKIENPKNLQEVGRAKVNYTVEYCNSFQDKILVVFYFKQTGKMLKARLGDKAVLIDGSSTDREIRDAKEAFAGDTQILLGSSVLAEGLDFSFCNNILLVEEPNYSMRTDQIRERCNRVNKQEEVTIDILVVPGTQDERVYDLLRNKYDLQYGLRDS